MKLPQQGFGISGLGAWGWASGSGSQAWGEDTDYLSKTLGMLGWEGNSASQGFGGPGRARSQP